MFFCFLGSRNMETLHSGVILELLEDMDIEEKTVIDDCDHYKKPALLQIRSIVPVLAEGDDLWPKHGFFLKVSDSTHAMYVSLPQEDDEMVLCNKLQLGQFIYVEKLEVAYPVPMLKGIKAIPGRQPLDGDPKDLLGIDIMEKICGSPKLLKQDKPDVKKQPSERARSTTSPCKVPLKERRASIGGQNCRIRTPDVEKECFGKGCSRNKLSFLDNDSDGLTSSSCSFVSHSRRRSWSGIPKTRSWEIPDSAVVKHEITTVRQSPNSHVSPVCSARNHNFHDNSNPRKGIKDISIQSPKPAKIQKNSRNSSSARASKESFSNKKCAATEMLGDTLPSSLVKLGKEVLKQRDAVLLAAVDALQEAAATERLLRCLSTFSELQSSKGDDQQSSINKFFKLKDYLAQCGVIVQSLTNLSPPRMADSNSNSPRYCSIREAVKLAAERKRYAVTWVKTAVASDLIPLSASRTKNVSGEVKDEEKSTNKPSQVSKLKGTCTIRKQKNMGEFYSGLAAEKENLHWVKGNALTTAGNLAHSLQDECKTWFLAYIDNYLDSFDNECLSKIPDCQLAESMCQIKRLNDWLEMIEKKEGSSDNLRAKSSELETCRRVRNKIYGVLLKHVERTAIALENKKATAEG